MFLRLSYFGVNVFKLWRGSKNIFAAMTFGLGLSLEDVKGILQIILLKVRKCDPENGSIFEAI